MTAVSEAKPADQHLLAEGPRLFPLEIVLQTEIMVDGDTMTVDRMIRDFGRMKWAMRWYAALTTLSFLLMAGMFYCTKV